MVPRRPSAARSRSLKAFAFPENSSKTPITSSSPTIGIMTTEAMPSCRHPSRFTRGSRSASSQRNARRVRTLSPESPYSVESSAPSSGAFDPALARHSMSCATPRRRAMAAPLAPVMYCARSASSCRAASRSRSAMAARDRPPSSPGKPILAVEDDPEDVSLPSLAGCSAFAAVILAETLACAALPPPFPGNSALPFEGRVEASAEAGDPWLRIE